MKLRRHLTSFLFFINRPLDGFFVFSVFGITEKTLFFHNESKTTDSGKSEVPLYLFKAGISQDELIFLIFNWRV